MYELHENEQYFFDQTVEAVERNEIEFFSNLPVEDVRRLAGRKERERADS